MLLHAYDNHHRTARRPAASAFLAAAAVIALFTMSGCATNSPSRGTSASSWRPQTALVEEEMAQYRAQSEQIGDRLRAACVSPKYKAYFAKTACLPSGITDEMTADRSKITAVQKRAALEVFKLTHSLSEEMRDFMVQTGLPELIDRAEASRQTTDPLINDLQKRLLDGKITWGQYNAERRTLSSRAHNQTP